MGRRRKKSVTVLRPKKQDLAKLLFDSNPSLSKAFSAIFTPSEDAVIVIFFFFMMLRSVIMWRVF